MPDILENYLFNFYSIISSKKQRPFKWEIQLTVNNEKMLKDQKAAFKKFNQLTYVSFVKFVLENQMHSQKKLNI